MSVEARWTRNPDPTSTLQLTDTDGQALGVPPGRTWIGLVPEAGSFRAS
jgi:hypothetical protein